MKGIFFGLGLKFDSGTIPSVAMNRSGKVLSVHKNEAGFKLFYHVGRLNQATIDWGPSRSYDTGNTPDVALNGSGLAVEVHKNEAGSTLYYHVGTVGEDAVDWSVSRKYDTGVKPAVAVNDSGVVVEVHKTQSGNTLYYHLGHVQGDQVKWGVSTSYGSGDTPRVAMNNSGVVVEVHRSQGANTLWYHVGRVSGTKIAFGGSVHFDDGDTPAVALTDDGFVIVTFRRPSGALHGRCGQVNGERIEWLGEAVSYDDGTHTSVAAAGKMCVEVHQGESLPTLWFSTSLITDRASWMQDRLDTLGDRTLSSLVLPASHDAGMYPGGVSLGGKTQDLSLYGQLSAGIRYFDLRVRREVGTLVIYHGVMGPAVSEVLRDVRRFAMEGHREVVILKFSHFEHIDDKDYQELVAKIEEFIGPWMLKNLPAGKRLADVTLSECAAEGPVIIVVVDQQYAINYRRPGFWVFRDWQSADPSIGDLRVFDLYAKTTNFEKMKNDQLGKFAAYDGKMEKEPSVPCDMFLLSWTLTPGTGVWFSAQEANRRLGHELSSVPPTNQHGRMMNLLYVDYCEYARVTDVALFRNGERI